MGKQSALGPIDPQITFPTKDGFRTAPAFDLLAEFAQAKAEVSAGTTTWTATTWRTWMSND